MPAVAAAIADAVAHESAGINRYPDNGAQALVAALAEHTGAPQSHIVAGCGSVALCQQLVQAVAGEGDEVLFGWRSFEAYPIVTQITGAASGAGAGHRAATSSTCRRWPRRSPRRPG